ncbi:hypothetical protein BKA70DRAFT_1480184 [Coprinopsis sp. MPI-PUGE-AT-0042]|nr:hypothetical protein BKA70DRAFT_1480184 [Coprinopsis sp. MPI-PUGE-AT-0042]
MVLAKDLEEAELAEWGIEVRVAYLIGFWLEGFLYGMHALPPALGMEYMNSQAPKSSSLSDQRVSTPTPQVTSIFLPIIAFAYQTDIHGTRRMFNDLEHWANFPHSWQHHWVIVVPSLLAAAATGFHLWSLGFARSDPMSSVLVRNWPMINLPLIFYLCQNTLTTSLIVYKIYIHYRQTRAIGLVSVHAPSLLATMKVIIESVVIYTAGMLILVVLVALDHPARFAMLSCLMPVAGTSRARLLTSRTPQRRGLDRRRTSSVRLKLTTLSFKLSRDTLDCRIPERYQRLKTDPPGNYKWLFELLEIPVENLQVVKGTSKTISGSHRIVRGPGIKKVWMVTGLKDAGPLTVAEIQVKVIYLVGIWAEAMLYGTYLCFFIAALPVLFRSNKFKSFPAAVFVMGNALMFILITIHTSIRLFQSVVAFAYQTEIHGPFRVFGDMGYWATNTEPYLGAATYMTGDILMIYRCFLLWQRNYWVVLVPVVLSALSTSLHIATLLFAHSVPASVVLVRNYPMIIVPAICYVLQTALTTSLIVYKIYSQFRQTRDIAFISIYTPAVLPIMRIIVESAVVYSTGMLALVVVTGLDHPARSMIHSWMIPITGTVFVLMALRTHAVQEEANYAPATASLMPTWLFEEPKSLGPNPQLVEQDQRWQAPTQTLPLTHPSAVNSQASS